MCIANFLYEQRDCALHNSFTIKGIVHGTVLLSTKGLCIAHFLYEQRDCALHISFMNMQCTVPLWAKGLCNAHFLYELRDCALHSSFLSKELCISQFLYEQRIVYCTVPLWAKGLCFKGSENCTILCKQGNCPIQNPLVDKGTVVISIYKRAVYRTII